MSFHALNAHKKGQMNALSGYELMLGLMAMFIFFSVTILSIPVLLTTRKTVIPACREFFSDKSMLKKSILIQLALTPFLLIANFYYLVPLFLLMVVLIPAVTPAVYFRSKMHSASFWDYFVKGWFLGLINLLAFALPVAAIGIVAYIVISAPIQLVETLSKLLFIFIYIASLIGFISIIVGSCTGALFYFLRRKPEKSKKTAKKSQK